MSHARSYGKLIHPIVCRRKARFRSEHTCFMQNRHQLEMICECIAKSYFSTPVRGRLPNEMTALFDSSGEHFIVKESIRNGINWKGYDIADPYLQAKNELEFNPELSGIRAIHHGYPPILDDWPGTHWGLEPYDPHHCDHDFRYSTLFRAPVGPDPPRV